MSDTYLFLSIIAACVVLWPIIRLFARYGETLLRHVEERHQARLRGMDAYIEQSVAQHRAFTDQTIIVQIIQRAQSGPRFRHTETALHAPSHQGFVYLMCMNNEYYKIGFASNVQSRYLSIRSSTPYKLDLTHVIATQHMARLEGILHARYAEKRLDGEWFRLAPEDVAAICAIASPITVADIDRQSF